MKKIFYISTVLFLFSCEQKKPEYSKEVEEAAQKSLDSVLSDIDQKLELDTKQSYLDKSLTQNSPVEIINSKFIKEEYSKHKGVSLTFRNTTKKDIQAIRFEWYGENSFGEPADMGSNKGESGGFTEEKLPAGAKRTARWDMVSIDGKNIIGARAYEVAFTDGSKWKLNKPLNND